MPPNTAPPVTATPSTIAAILAPIPARRPPPAAAAPEAVATLATAVPVAVAPETAAEIPAPAVVAAAVSAAYYLADADFHLEKYDEAASLFGEYISKAGKDAPMYLQALEGQAYTAEAKKDYAKAEALFRQLSETSKGDAMKGRALFNAARQLELLGKKDEAANAYAKIDADFATKAFEVSRTARDRLALLAAQGIKPVKSGDTAPEAAK